MSLVSKRKTRALLYTRLVSRRPRYEAIGQMSVPCIPIALPLNLVVQSFDDDATTNALTDRIYPLVDAAKECQALGVRVRALNNIHCTCKQQRRVSGIFLLEM
jgi:hypothetical protein